MKKIYIVAGVVGVLLIVLFWHRDFARDVVPVNGGPISVTLSGTYVCLPLIDAKAPPTEDCVFGLKADDGVYYMVNFGQSAVVKAQFDKGAHITAEGFVVPKEALSTDHWVPYNMKGIFTVTQIIQLSQPSGSGGGVTPLKFGVTGKVLLGPTCPVMRDPPDPQCADKPYATTIMVYKAGSGAVVATGKSAADGTFNISLPAGHYTLEASGGATLPRCSPVDVVVGRTGYAPANISCDTGIR